LLFSISFFQIVCFRLPADIYQTAKVSKLLLMMEKGTIPAEYKGKSLGEINFDINLEYAEENNDGKCIKSNLMLVKNIKKANIN
jgi:hypothetical protein